MKQLRRRLTYANVMSSIVVFVMLGGATAFAAGQLGKDSVGAKQLRKNAVTSAKVKDGSLQATDLAADQLPAGAEGAPGALGPQGFRGAAGLSGVELVTKFTSTDSTSQKSLSIDCPPGKKVIGIGFDIDGALGGVSPNQFKEATIDDATTTSADLGTAFFRAFEQKGGTAASWFLKGFAICARVG